MALPSSGQLSINDIRSYIGTSEGSLFILSTSYASFADPYSISNFYGYSTCLPYGTYITSFCSGCQYYYQYADGSCGTYNTLINADDPSCGPNCGGGGSYACAEPPFYECNFYPNPCWYYGYYDCLAPA